MSKTGSNWQFEPQKNGRDRYIRYATRSTSTLTFVPSTILYLGGKALHMIVVSVRLSVYWFNSSWTFETLNLSSLRQWEYLIRICALKVGQIGHKIDLHGQIGHKRSPNFNLHTYPNLIGNLTPNPMVTTILTSKVTKTSQNVCAPNFENTRDL